MTTAPSNPMADAADAAQTADQNMIDGLDTLTTRLRAALLHQHYDPDGTARDVDMKLTRFEQGQREGRIVAHLEVLTTLHPAYAAMMPSTLRIVLLGEALTSHARES
jgi:hypothetical protein